MYRFHLFIVMCGVLLLNGCLTPDDLSNQNSVLRFEVVGVSDAEVVLGDVEIVSDSNLIKVPMLYGESYLPFSLDADVWVSDGARLLGMNPSAISFSAGQTEQVFYVVAQNGATREWRVQLLLPEDVGMSHLVQFEVERHLPSSAYVLRNGQIVSRDSVVDVVVPECVFPLTLYPRVEVAAGCEVQDLAGEGLVFQSYDSEHRFKVLTPEGVYVEWRVRLFQPPLLTGIDGVGWSVYRAVSYLPDNLSFLSEPALRRVVDGKQDVVWFLEQQGEVLPEAISGAVSFSHPLYVFPIGIASGDEIELLHDDAAVVSYLYDSVRRHCKRWEFRLVESDYYYGGFRGFRVLQNSPSSMRVLSDSIVIDALGGVVWVPYVGTTSYPFSLKVGFETVAGSVVSGLTDGGLLRYFGSEWDGIFTLRSGCGVERRWQVLPCNAATLASMVHVSGCEVLRCDGADGKLQVKRYAEVDNVAGKIRIVVEDWSDDLPMSITLRLDVLDGVRLLSTGWNGNDNLVFNSYTDDYMVFLSSADGTVNRIYRIELENRARTRLSDAELLSFGVHGLSAGYGVGNVEIDAAQGRVVLELTSVGSGMLQFTPQWQLSPGAYVDGLSGVLRFTNLNQGYDFEVVSEDESVRRAWRLVVNASPQLDNWDLDSWNSTYEAVGWASANSSFGNTMERAVRDDGYCAKLTTSTVLGNVAAGSLFLGRFKIDLSQLGNTKMMTYMGIPFSGRPVAVVVDLKYDANGGDDMGSVGVELLNYVGNDFEYHNIGNEAGVTVVARGSYTTGTTSGWQTVTIPIDALNGGLTVTHIHVIFSSSYRGDDLVGTVGATLWVDNVRLVY